MNEIIRTQHLSKEYKMGSQRIKALDNVDLSVNEGSFVSVVGTSGSGKSTLLHLIGGLDKPSDGEVWLAGKSLKEAKDKNLSKIRRENIGYVFQNFCLIQELNVIENIMLPQLLSNKKPDMNYLHTLCDVLGLTDRMQHLPGELSGGQQQRVAIARALSNDPIVVLCDEPTGNLDKKTSSEVVHLLKSINREMNKTILIVTHDPDVANTADVQIQIEDGRIV